MTFDEDVTAHYEAWYETLEGRRADRLEKAVLSRLLQGFSRPATILEVGCGTAHFTRWLSDQGLAAVGLDLSAAMLAQARSLDALPPAPSLWEEERPPPVGEGRDGELPLVRGDALRLPFADSTFDLVAFVTTLEFLEWPQQALAEALRVARCGVVLGVLNRWSLLGLQRQLAGLFRRTVYDAAHFYGVRELKRLATGGCTRSVAGGKARIVWHTTLFPRWWPWMWTSLPWGGFIGMALMAGDRVQEEGR